MALIHFMLCAHLIFVMISKGVGDEVDICANYRNLPTDFFEPGHPTLATQLGATGGAAAGMSILGGLLAQTEKVAAKQFFQRVTQGIITESMGMGAVSGGATVVIGLGVIFFVDNWEYGKQLQDLLSKTRGDVDQLKSAYQALLNAFALLRLDLATASQQILNFEMCRIMGASSSFVSTVDGVIHQVKVEQIKWKNCWFWCGKEIPNVVLDELNDLATNLGLIKDDFATLLKCAPNCDKYLIPKLAGIAEKDMGQVCRDVKGAICNYPDNADACYNFPKCKDSASPTLALVTRVTTPASQIPPDYACTAADPQNKTGVVQCTVEHVHERIRHSENGQQVLAHWVWTFTITLVVLSLVHVCIFAKLLSQPGPPHFLVDPLLSDGATSTGAKKPPSHRCPIIASWGFTLLVLVGVSAGLGYHMCLQNESIQDLDRLRRAATLMEVDVLGDIQARGENANQVLTQIIDDMSVAVLSLAKFANQ